MHHDLEPLASHKALSRIVDQDELRVPRLQNEHAPANSQDVSAIFEPIEWEQVEPLLRRVEGEHGLLLPLGRPQLILTSENLPRMFYIMPIDSPSSFCNVCRLLYKERKDGSPVKQPLVYSGLTKLCEEFTLESNTEAAARYYDFKRAFSLVDLNVPSPFPTLHSCYPRSYGSSVRGLRLLKRTIPPSHTTESTS